MFKFSICRVAVLIVFTAVSSVLAAGLIECIFPSESAATVVCLFTKDEAAEVVEQLKQVPEYTTKLLDVTHGVSSGSSSPLKDKLLLLQSLISARMYRERSLLNILN